MMKKIFIFALLIVLLILGVVFILGKQPAGGLREGFKPDAERTNSAVRPLVDDEGVAKPPDVAEADWQRFLRMHAARKASNRKVSFYGRIIDQNGDPVPGVVISTEITRREESIAKIIADGKDQITDTVNLVTDSNGLFFVNERKGYALSLEKVSKAGYIFPNRDIKTKFMFGQLLRNPESSEFHHSDPDRPVVFPMWKMGKTEPLIAMGYELKFLEKEGIDTLYLPLVLKPKAEPTPMEGWDIKAKVKIHTRRDWELSLEGNDGCGFIITDDVHTNLAPESGYQQSITVSGDPNERTTSKRITKIYFRGRNGSKYAAFRMECSPYGQRDENNFVIHFTNFRINPNGSRNLEFDKTKQIKDDR